MPRTAPRLILLLIAGAALAACSSAQGTPEGVEEGVYPDFSKPISSAMKQMSDEEAARMSAQMTALAHARQRGGVSEAEYRRRLAEMNTLSTPTN